MRRERPALVANPDDMARAYRAAIHRPLRNLPVGDGPVAVIALASQKGDAARRSALSSDASEVGRSTRIRYAYPAQGAIPESMGMTVCVSLIELHDAEALSQHISTTNNPQSGINTKFAMLWDRVAVDQRRLPIANTTGAAE